MERSALGIIKGDTRSVDPGQFKATSPDPTLIGGLYRE